MKLSVFLVLLPSVSAFVSPKPVVLNHLQHQQQRLSSASTTTALCAQKQANGEGPWSVATLWRDMVDSAMNKGKVDSTVSSEREMGAVGVCLCCRDRPWFEHASRGCSFPARGHVCHLFFCPFADQSPLLPIAKRAMSTPHLCVCRACLHRLLCRACYPFCSGVVWPTSLML